MTTSGKFVPCIPRDPRVVVMKDDVDEHAQRMTPRELLLAQGEQTFNVNPKYPCYWIEYLVDHMNSDDAKLRSLAGNAMHMITQSLFMWTLSELHLKPYCEKEAAQDQEGNEEAHHSI